MTVTRPLGILLIDLPILMRSARRGSAASSWGDLERDLSLTQLALMLQLLP